MSAELRLKKLRGSGGYIMALVTDDQQRKGNLGGPDLFLAPVGRLEKDKISKYYCNTCEKDYEGSPKIDYDNPNELVADNLMLLEKGQYICTACGSVLAEYRNFSKPKESADVGFAKPQQAYPPQPHSPPTYTPQPPSPPTYTPQPPSPPTYTPQPPSPQPSPSTEPPRVTQTYSQPAPPLEPSRFTQAYSRPEVFPIEVTTFNSIIGTSVYDLEARKIGIVKEVGIQIGQPGVVLVVTKKDGRDIAIKWEEIKKINEIVLVGEEVSKTSSKCTRCGFDNKPDSKFCESCGKKLK